MKHRFNNRGFSLIEVTIASSITIIIIGAIGAILQPILNLKNQLDTNSGLYSATMYFRDCITNDAAWSNTVAANLSNNFDCLTNKVGCADQSTDTAKGIGLSLMSAKAKNCLDGYDTKDGSATGLTKDGVVCSGYTPSGNPLCPYRINFSWLAICPLGEANCVNPIVKVIGKMVHSNSNESLSGKAPAVQLDLAKFSVSVIRGRSDQVRSFTLLETSVPSTGCRAGKVNFRVFNTKQDSGNYIRGTTDFGGTSNAAFTLEPGTYDCEISVPGFLTGNFRSALFNTSNMAQPLLQGTSEFSPAFWGYNETRSIIVGTFSLTALSNLVVAEWCTSSAIDPTLLGESMGVSSGITLGSVPDVFATMHCSVLSPLPNQR